MRRMKLGFMAAVLMILLGARTASAREAWGYLVCESDESIAVSGAVLTFTQGSVVSTSYEPTTAQGWYGFMLWPGDFGLWSVSIDLTAQGGPSNYDAGQVTIVETSPLSYVPTIKIPAGIIPACGGTPPPPVCEELSGVENGSTFCGNLGNPRNECAYFGLVPAGKDDGLSGLTHEASMDADLALVKAGLCYKVYVGVSAGDELQTPNGKGISHVTYCSCE
ncbi:hypothetical protein PSR1_03545 [Anaeromyxobacter sp. PSR-1]|nr:hypothetical protein PSR1_03545 [Anaeromyxobacter sp. PSR-1]